ncbi:hypothetical protein [Emcibacter sp. SYSU 3D8]|uniref:hypothetical protein n=1 Tax=Emcibacter sp. SYSU 3D8 TaxID=3133969 RepID=UPI0031FEF244
MSAEKSPWQDAASIPRSEWAVAIAGALLVLVVIGYMVHLALTEKGTPPDISVAIETVRPASGGYLAEIKAVNEGGSTAADVTIEAAMTDDGQEVEARQVMLDFLPMHSERTAGIVFEHDPGRFHVELRVLSHREP